MNENTNNIFSGQYSLANYQANTKKGMREDMEKFQKELDVLKQIEAEGPARRQRIASLEGVIAMYRDSLKYGGRKSRKARKTRRSKRRSL